MVPMNTTKIYTPNCEVLPGMTVPPGTMRWALMIEYDGTPYKGFQKQSFTPDTVQGHLEQALSYVANHGVTLVCAGRTDAGVHATSQVVHFDTQALRPSRAWVEGTNTKLPSGIRVKCAHQVSFDFHARFSATSRTYHYVLLHTAVRPAILARAVTWSSFSLDVKAMNEAAQYLLGEHDFSSFRASQCQARSPVRDIKALSIKSQGYFVVVEIQANAFLHHMVRNIVGALLEVARGAQLPSWVGQVLERKSRAAAPATAHAFGLYLTGVEYPKALGLPTFQQRPVFLT